MGFLRFIGEIVILGIVILIGYCVYETAARKYNEAEKEGRKGAKIFWGAVAVITILIAVSIAPKNGV